MLKSRFPVSEFKEWINSDEIGLERDLNDSTDSVTTAADCCTFARLAFQYMESGGENADFFREIYTSTDDQLFQSDLEVGQKLRLVGQRAPFGGRRLRRAALRPRRPHRLGGADRGGRTGASGDF